MADKLKPPQQTGWLWRLAVLIAVATVGLIYLIDQDPGNFKAREHKNLVILIASILIGICAISATSQWWLKR